MEHLELSDFVCVLFLLHQVVRHQVNVGDVLKTIKLLLGAHRHQLLQSLLHVEALGTREKLELLGLEDKVEARHLAQVPLQVEGTILQEENLLVAKRLFFWEHGEWHAWEPARECLLKKEELVVAALALPRSLSVHTLDLVVD